MSLRVDRFFFPCLVVCSLVFSVPAVSAYSPPVISNVTASQRTDGSHVVDVYYDLSGDPSTIEVEVSDDAGVTWDVPIASVSGDVGPGIAQGIGKHIIWNSLTDLPGFAGSQYEFRICANDAALALIPAGEFVMGDHHDGDPFGAGGLPLHTVYVDAFYMDKFEVTNQQYAAALNWANSQGNLITVSSGLVHHSGDMNIVYCPTTTYDLSRRITWNGSAFGVVAGKENHPMLDVTWHGSAAYANWRSGMEGRTPAYDTTTWACNFSANGYRLPTEAEWERAARGGNYGPYYRYPWGNSIDDGSVANFFQSGDPYESGPFPWTTPVGYYNGGQTPPGVDMANGYGLYDMIGNEWEWCNDWWSGSYYSSSPYNNPQGPASGFYRVLRGGAWSNGSQDILTCASRGYNDPNVWASDYGFRLALNGTGPAQPPSCDASPSFTIDNAITYGDINHSGSVNLDDILCILSCFAGNFACAGSLAIADIVPCGGNGVVNIDDILAILQAFAGADLCP